MRYIALIIISFFLIEMPALAAAPLVLKEDKTVWSGDVRLESDVIVPEGKTLIIMPGTKIYGVYDYVKDKITPNEWRIIVKGDLVVEEGVLISPVPEGKNAIRVPINLGIKNIKIEPLQIDTEKIREEFSVFRVQYLILWTMLFASIYYAILSR